jgi:hypothetical protein
MELTLNSTEFEFQSECIVQVNIRYGRVAG